MEECVKCLRACAMRGGVGGGGGKIIFIMREHHVTMETASDAAEHADGFSSFLPPSFYLTVQFGVSSLKCKIKTDLCAVFKMNPARYRHAFSRHAPQTPEKNTARLWTQAPAAKNGYRVLHLSHVRTFIVSFLR